MDEQADRDQMQAAAAEALRWAEQVAETMGVGVEQRKAPDWVSDRMREVGEAGMRGEVKMCVHLYQDGPRPAYLYVCRPNQLLCFDCFGILSATIQGTKDDRTCDKCGKECDGLFADLAIFGPVTAIFGLCDDCQATESLLRGQPG